MAEQCLHNIPTADMELVGDTFEDDTTDSDDEDKDHVGYDTPDQNIRHWVSAKYVNGRAGHVCVQYKDQVIVWGGIHRNPYRFLPPEELLLFCPASQTWSCVITTGDIPPGRSGTAAVLEGDFLFIACGFDQDIFNRSDRIWSLDLRFMVWKQLLPSGKPPIKSDKGCGWTFEGKIYVFGGFGLKPLGSEVLESDFTEIEERTPEVSGWTNQLVCYDPVTNTWSWPRTHGRPPLPRAGHAVSIVGSKVFILGGRNGGSRLSDLHSLDMGSMVWENILPDSQGGRGPAGRTWHSMVSLQGSDGPSLLVYGGFSNDNRVLRDCWKLRLTSENLTWEKSSLNLTQPRWWHSMVVVDHMIIVTGGLYSDSVHPHDCLIQHIKPQSLVNTCHQAIRLEMEFHLRSKSLQDLPRNLLTTVLMQKIDVNVHNYQDLRILALSVHDTSIARALLQRISHFCNKYNFKIN